MENRNISRLIAWVLVAAMPLWFGSCKKGSDDTVTPTTSSVQGSWKISGYKIDPGVDFSGTGQKSNDLLAYFKSLPNGIGNDIADCLTSTTITFNANGKITGTPGAKCTASTDMNPVEDNSTWKLDGNKLTITSGSDVSTYDTVISGNTLKMSENQLEDYDGDGKEETYTVTLELTKV
ncbi:lipocalin-like domain-containing protein [Spirosoma flavum]|uniref:Lipocalin family protein n=1 Tax=Spirosoma flavum TaxID=2048557 RepID=A0ABW6ADL7_9BACT